MCRRKLTSSKNCSIVKAGAEFGSDGPYGSALTKVGQAEQKLGQCERDFIGSSHSCFIQPLRRFLDGEMKTISKERGILESKRLDLDACKSRVRKARSMLGQQAVIIFCQDFYANIFFFIHNQSHFVLLNAWKLNSFKRNNLKFFLLLSPTADTNIEILEICRPA